METKRLRQLAGLQLNEGSDFIAGNDGGLTATVKVPAFIIVSDPDSGDRAFREFLTDVLGYKETTLDKIDSSLTQDDIGGYDSPDHVLVLINKSAKVTNVQIAAHVRKYGDDVFTCLE